jgi:CubicO group peptidase (beta-lactamase class C family)
MTEPATAEKILNEWAKKPLDFEPGTRWQYSNTNYVIAGRIVEKVAGEPFFSVLSKRILQPLGMASAIDLDTQTLGPQDAAGYTRFVFGPARPAPLEGRGWLYASGELAMTAHDLALWDISLLRHTLLKPESIETMFTPARLRDGSQLDYALGVEVTSSGGHPKVNHSGAVSGFVSLNTLWPDQGAAIVALANMDGSGSIWTISNQLAPLLLSAEADDSQAAQALQQAREIFSSLAQGKIDRSLLSPNADAFFTPQVLSDAAASLKELGPPEFVRQTSSELRGGMMYRHFLVRFRNASFPLSTLTLSDGKLEEFLIQ